ncbi:nitrite reductase small subunit NirD [Photobacterium aphoticum]|uniref:Nitrite reductase n=2 Tax=Photobacterium aphoticum TaxID=754436 RepID=A0A0J1GKN5_9GAMM|nr:nitrite reductase small subunit NirD [Photobacterium aphoticum]KLV00275.1 nitrite reductase [Photobacterium aphoticum]PSU55521.1 nitrite reductase (NAD(P)H) small subunit [Photobacterium aphoticum]
MKVSSLQAASPATPSTSRLWQTICAKQDLPPHAGVCVRLNERHVAIFFCARTGALYAVDNFDPIDKTSVLSRGIIGSIGEEAVVASPLFKQHFNLKTGQCLEQPDIQLKTYPIRCHEGLVQVAV